MPAAQTLSGFAMSQVVLRGCVLPCVMVAFFITDDKGFVVARIVRVLTYELATRM